ncbi:hypothetical protein GCM10010329_20280 [Streptomyces spiroverticillatus]|uniref:Uncharacterized protein n=1 Tax=Streptomyces finlayi TaxID=67296 RepID=A0A918WUA6_9ACTN|nr:hypothetical protein [Streptomyces finlayi]GGZ98652.1 hypothetical protein GCM10010329_20280 [Streptomyces spiroverticillatus]GHC83531.1 hypothetical protein GCM10010334_12720 [Streptomyces finlayi]
MMDTGHTRGRRAGRRTTSSRFATPLGLATVVALGLSLATPQTALAGEIAGESFTGTAVDGGEDEWISAWKGESDASGWACLTAATGAKGP